MRGTALGEWLQAWCLRALQGAASSILWQDSTTLPTKANGVPRPSPDLLTALSRTMMCDWGTKENEPTLEAEQLELVGDLLTYVFETSQGHSIELPRSLTGEDSAFNTITAKWSAVRRFCFTSKGRLGQLAPGSEPGDRIWVA